MGIGNVKFEKLMPTEEVPSQVLDIVRVSVLETLQSDFYHSEDEHAKSAIELHKHIATKYPNFYTEVYSDPEFTDYFLDAHKVMSIVYLLQHAENLDAALHNITHIQPNRIEDVYRICKLKELFGTDVKTSLLRKLFGIHSKWLEESKGKDLIGYYGVKYASGIKNIMATTRVRRKSLSPVWQEVMDWVFEHPVKSYTTKAMDEAAKLRQLVVNKRPLLFDPKFVPFSVWRGYATALGLSEYEIFSRGHHLMTKNETKRYLNTLQKHGILHQERHRDEIVQRVMNADVDLMSLMYTLKVLGSTAKEIIERKGSAEYKKTVDELSEIFKDKTTAIAVDCSGGCAGHQNMLDPEIQKKIAKGERIPRWASIVQRETFNGNALIAKIISDASQSCETYLFNESCVKTDLPETFEELVEELKHVECGGGSNILLGLESAISSNPDIAIVVSDMNENVPFMGALKSKIAEIAEKFDGIIIFIMTDTIVERPEAVNIDEIIKEKGLQNKVYILPANKISQLKKAFVLIKLIEKAKKIYVKTEKKKKKSESNENA